MARLFLSPILIVLLVVLSSIAYPRVARAQTNPVPPAPLVAQTVAEKPSLWRQEWPQFRVSEGIATIAAGIATLTIVLVGPADQPRWEGPILFDEPVRNALRAEDPETSRTYRKIGDWTYRLSPVLPIVDAVLVSTIGHHDSKLALNLGGMLAEAYSYSGLTSYISTQATARQRPYADCHDGQGCDTQSFFSGHSAIAATGAGLMCANHTRIALYGNPFLDIGVCVLASANALVTATTRVVADRHYATDVLLGTSFGFAFGYGVPVLLHYSYGPKNDRTIAFAPDPSCGGNCIGVRGTF